ncbi:hypothetical protein BT69DRAFT_1337634 [Atractiella rhizophila]|nr:hypothetical protein BT69DRAFT_1337634 [Atractiella rhizophila]
MPFAQSLKIKSILFPASSAVKLPTPAKTAANHYGLSESAQRLAAAEGLTEEELADFLEVRRLGVDDLGYIYSLDAEKKSFIYPPTPRLKPVIPIHQGFSLLPLDLPAPKVYLDFQYPLGSRLSTVSTIQSSIDGVGAQTEMPVEGGMPTSVSGVFCSLVEPQPDHPHVSAILSTSTCKKDSDKSSSSLQTLVENSKRKFRFAPKKDVGVSKGMEERVLGRMSILEGRRRWEGVEAWEVVGPIRMLTWETMEEGGFVFWRERAVPLEYVDALDHLFELELAKEIASPRSPKKANYIPQTPTGAPITITPAKSSAAVDYLLSFSKSHQCRNQLAQCQKTGKGKAAGEQKKKNRFFKRVAAKVLRRTA